MSVNTASDRNRTCRLQRTTFLLGLWSGESHFRQRLSRCLSTCVGQGPPRYCGSQASLLKQANFRRRADTSAAGCSSIVGRNAIFSKFQRFQVRKHLVHLLLLSINMSRYISRSILFLIFGVILCSGLYPQSLRDYFEPRLSAASYDPADSFMSRAPASTDSSPEQNPDSAVVAAPLSEHSTQKLCHFFDC